MKIYSFENEAKRENKEEKIDRIIREKMKTIYKQNCFESLSISIIM